MLVKITFTFSCEGFFWSKLPATTRIVLLAPRAPHFGTLLLDLPWMPPGPPCITPDLPLGLPCRGHLPKLTSEQLTGLHAPSSACPPHSLNIVTLFLKPSKISKKSQQLTQLHTLALNFGIQLLSCNSLIKVEILLSNSLDLRLLSKLIPSLGMPGLSGQLIFS